MKYKRILLKLSGESLQGEQKYGISMEQARVYAQQINFEKEKKAVNAVEKGLMRLAFGSVADAMKLMLCEDAMTSEDIEKLDLFNVSEIKRPKGGGLEIKFFDRLKALEKLAALGGGEENSQSSFIKALSEGARLLSEEENI